MFANLQAVLTRYVDSSLGYDEAAKVAGDGDTAMAFAEIADARAEDSAQIAACIEALGKHADSRGSTEAMLHRWWIDLRDKISGSDPGALLDECLRGECELLRTIKAALEDDPGVPAYRAALDTAQSNVEATLARLHLLSLRASGMHHTQS
jgi:uncharacterized protein (TIGR02284 family)